MEAGAVSESEEEHMRNVRAFMFERFRMVADQVATERSQPEVSLDRLETLAGAVRAQLLRQVEEAELTRSAFTSYLTSTATSTATYTSRVERVATTQDERRRDLLLIRSQAPGYVPLELAAIAYLEAEGDVVDAIQSLDSVSQRERFEQGLRQRQAQLGLRATEQADLVSSLLDSEERRQAIREARRAFQRAALQHRRELQAPLHDNNFADDLREFREAVIPDRGAGHWGVVREAIRSEMEVLEEQVEACTIDENTYNEKAVALKDRFEKANGDAQLRGVSHWLRANASAQLEEVD